MAEPGGSLTSMSYGSLGESYAITLPVVGHTSMELPVQKITHDAMSYALEDLKLRVKAKLPVVIGVGLLGVAGYLVIKRM
jgi:hypothetical protein